MIRVRSTAKAIILDGGRVLLNQCRDESGAAYYSLPGGGQNAGEALTEAVVRECLEETGYRVVPLRLAAVCELIYDAPSFRERHPGYAHQLLHIFLCRLASPEQGTPTERDSGQLASVWTPIGSVAGIGLRPRAAGEQLERLLDGQGPVYLGAEHLL